ncbi:outer membrane beta-barrel protein [Dasania marina]|uniref:outer membrane beta-barrel protein n=1 Tax=Dasania marina TaxID=471499 RepID=UPI0030DD9333|tara:strand:+ start:50630 stop:51121 length:492 start_codon:yes stop_codon:yes gene_type:complete
MKNALLPLVLCTALTNTTLAAEPSNTRTTPHKGAYAGLAFGSSDYDDGELFEQLRVSKSHNLTRLYGGYQFNRYFMTEAALTSLGEHEAKNTQVDIDTTFSALMFSVIAQYPSDFGLAVYGQLGLGLVSVYQEYHYINLNTNLIEGDDDESDGAWLTGAGGWA